LQVRDVFTDVINGKRAKRSDLLQAFELGDIDAVGPSRSSRHCCCNMQTTVCRF
jgi:hypothetical protein